MKSKAHTKNSTVSSGSGSSTQQSATPSSESDTEDSGMDSSGKCFVINTKIMWSIQCF